MCDNSPIDTKGYIQNMERRKHRSFLWIITIIIEVTSSAVGMTTRSTTTDLNIPGSGDENRATSFISPSSSTNVSISPSLTSVTSTPLTSTVNISLQSVTSISSTESNSNTTSISAVSIQTEDLLSPSAETSLTTSVSNTTDQKVLTSQPTNKHIQTFTTGEIVVITTTKSSKKYPFPHWEGVPVPDLTTIRTIAFLAMIGTPSITFFVLILCRVRVILITRYHYKHGNMGPDLKLSTISMATTVESGSSSSRGYDNPAALPVSSEYAGNIRDRDDVTVDVENSDKGTYL